MRPALVVFMKEAREMLRDKRVISAAFIAPVFMIVLFVFLFGLLESKVTKKSDMRLAIVRSASNPMLAALQESGDIKVTLVKSLDEGLGLLDDAKVGAVVEFGPGFAENLAKGNANVTAHYDSSEPLSSIAMSATRGVTQELNKRFAQLVLEQHGIPQELAEPIAFISKDVNSADGLGGSMIVGLLPYLIVLWAFYGGFSTVSDLVAGEKERGTMETLLTSPISRSQVALGKFLALAVICFASSLTTLVGVVLVGIAQFEITKELFPTGLHVSALASLGMLGVLIPLVVLFASSLLAVSAYAKNVREAQTYLTLVSFVVLLPAVFSQFIGFTGAQNELWVRLTPILNAAVALKSALLNELSLGSFLITAGVNLVLGLAMLWAAIWLFRREAILTRV